jgi:hypothetical protein
MTRAVVRGLGQPRFDPRTYPSGRRHGVQAPQRVDARDKRAHDEMRGACHGVQAPQRGDARDNRAHDEMRGA